MKVNVHTNRGNQSATVIRENAKTRIVRLPDGNVVKRHKRKHAA